MENEKVIRPDIGDKVIFNNEWLDECFNQCNQCPFDEYRNKIITVSNILIGASESYISFLEGTHTLVLMHSGIAYNSSGKLKTIWPLYRANYNVNSCEEMNPDICKKCGVLGQKSPMCCKCLKCGNIIWGI